LPHDWIFERRIWSHMEMVRRNMKTLPTVSNLVDEAVVFNAATNMGRTYCAHGFYSLAVNLLERSLAGQGQLRVVTAKFHLSPPSTNWPLCSITKASTTRP